MITIYNLKEKPHLTSEVVNHLWKEWGNEDNYLFVERMIINILGNQTNDIPQLYIATKCESLVGIVILLRNDLKSRQDLYPWLACLLVLEDYRSQNIGKALQKHVLHESKTMGYKKVYLITKLESYYEKTCWTFIGDEPLVSGEMTNVYEFNLDNYYC